MEDVKIVQLFWDRDPDAIDHTARKYGDYCFSIARNILGTPMSASMIPGYLPGDPCRPIGQISYPHFLGKS